MAVSVDSRDNASVPYATLADAERVARDVFPNAESVKAIWTPSSEHSVCIEVVERDERSGACEGRVYAWQA